MRVVGALRAVIDRLLALWMSVPVGIRAMLPIGLMVLLWWSSAQSPTLSEPSVLRALLHNGAHVVAYATLAVAVRLALPEGKRRRRLDDVISFVVAVAYGIVDELHQGYVPGRVSSLSDVMTDSAGAVFGLLVLGQRTGGGRAAMRLVVVATVCAGCVAFATFGPW